MRWTSIFGRLKPRVVSIWFSDTISPWRAFTFTDYMHSPDTGSHFGYVSEPSHTKVIDLERDEKAILADFSPTTRNYVHRARREGIQFVKSTDLGAFTSFFNRFSEQKSLGYQLKSEAIEKLGAELRIAHALYGEQVIVMHLFVCDRAKKRVRLVYAGSLRREKSTSISGQLFGIANRAAHFHEMCLFKSEGYSVFDLGGYAYRTDDPELHKINLFKDSFGGELVREATHRSLPLHVASRLINGWHRLKSTGRAGSTVRQVPRTQLRE